MLLTRPGRSIDSVVFSLSSIAAVALLPMALSAFQPCEKLIDHLLRSQSPKNSVIETLIVALISGWFLAAAVMVTLPLRWQIMRPVSAFTDAVSGSEDEKITPSFWSNGSTETKRL